MDYESGFEYILRPVLTVQPIFQDSANMMIQDAITAPSVAETSPYVLGSNGDSTNPDLPSSLKASQLDKGSCGKTKG